MSERNDLIDQMYGDDESLRSRFVPSIADDVSRIGDAEGWTPEQRDEALTILSRDFEDACLTPQEAAFLTSRIASGKVAPPTEEEANGWSVESRRVLRERYGDDAQVVARQNMMGQFVSNRPFLSRLLSESAAGQHPEVIRLLAEKASPNSSYSFRVAPRNYALGHKVPSGTLLGGK